MPCRGPAPQGQNLSEQCEAVLFAYLNLSAVDAAGSAVSDWKALSGRMQQALALSDRERGVAAPPHRWGIRRGGWGDPSRPNKSSHQHTSGLGQPSKLQKNAPLVLS